jgi:malate dehydrogenase (oxaloacetate-decarboxylating)
MEEPMSAARTPSPQYAITIRLDYPHEPGWVARIAGVIAREGGTIGAIDLVHVHRGRSLRDYTVDCVSEEHAQRIVGAIEALDDAVVESVSDDTFLLHLGGKLEVRSRIPLKTRVDLSMAYTPGVARVCRAIAEDPGRSFNLTIRKNCIAVVSDGSAVLGLGAIGAEAAMPVMEGKAILFKEFGGVDAFPICIDVHEPQQIVDFCIAIAPTFGGINLEDIAAPKCFEVEAALREALDIPVFHDDQHGTAVVVLAAFMNALKLTGRQVGDVKLVVAGAGAAGYSCTRTLQEYGVGQIVVCDRRGAIHRGRDVSDHPGKAWLAEHTNPDGERGSLAQVLRGADVFLGVSGPGLLTRGDVSAMAKDPIVFAMANPDPEIAPEEVHDLVAVMATGRSDYPNQINNVLAFPGIFRGALESRARTIDDRMKRAAARAIAEIVSDEDLSADYIVPSVFHPSVAKQVASGVARAARESGLARRTPKGGGIRG